MSKIIGNINHLPQNWQGIATILPPSYQATFAKAQQELAHLPSMISQQNFDFISFCYSLLTLEQASGQGQNHSQIDSQTLLINMQFAFEKWVSFQLKQQFGGQGLQVFEQYSQALTVDNALKIKPDILTTSENFTQVIDIKWKNICHISDIHLADMYQLLTYANQFDADEAWLVVPTLDKNQTKQEIQLAKAQKTRFFLVPFDLSA